MSKGCSIFWYRDFILIINSIRNLFHNKAKNSALGKYYCGFPGWQSSGTRYGNEVLN